MRAPVVVTLPCDSRSLALARLIASGVAAICGMVVEDIEDFRLVVDEVCATLLEADGGAPVRLVFGMAGSRLLVEGSAAAASDPGADRMALSDQILDVLADWHLRRRHGDHLEVIVAVELRAAGVG